MPLGSLIALTITAVEVLGTMLLALGRWVFPCASVRSMRGRRAGPRG